MKCYYIFENGRQSGPFSVEELKFMPLTKSTLVWTDGMADWETADKIDELRSILIPEPPPPLSSQPVTPATPAAPPPATILPPVRSSRISTPQPPPSSILPPVRSSRVSAPSPAPSPSPAPTSATVTELKSMAITAAKGLKSAAVATSKVLKKLAVWVVALLKSIKPSTIKYVLIGAGSTAVVTLLVVFGLRYLENSKYEKDFMIPVRSDNQWGYTDKKGTYLINPQFQDADYFFDGLARVRSSDGKTGYIGEDGNYAVAATYKDGTHFSGGLAFAVSTGGRPVCIDKSGNELFMLQTATQAYHFCEGLALFVSAEGKYGFVDPSGKTVIKPEFDKAYSFSEGLAAVLQGNKWGFMDKSGKMAINPQFESVYSFSEGKAYFSNGNRYGYIDRKGKIVINPQFDFVESFSDGRARIGIGGNSLSGYISGKGKVVVQPHIPGARAFHNGLAAVCDGSSCGFIDRKGAMVIYSQFNEVYDFFNGVAFVKSAGRWGIIDRTGQYLVNPQFDTMKTPYLPDETAFVESDFYDTSGFTNKFFERAQAGSFDGFNASSTLRTLLDNTFYASDVSAATQHQAISKKEQKITDDISIGSTTFYFVNPFYSSSNYGRQYHFNEQIACISYRFSLSGEASKKRRAPATGEALKTETEKRYGIGMRSIKGERDGFSTASEAYSGYDEKSKTGFVIVVDGDSVSLFVEFEKGIAGKSFDTDDTDDAEAMEEN